MVPSVSVIVPVYNSQEWLDRCLESILEQSLKSIEVILVDDGSPDRSGLMCDEFARRDDRVVVIHGMNTGIGGARRRGLAQARGEYVGFVDADDYIERNMYETMYAVALERKVDIVSCGHYCEWPTGTQLASSGLEKKRVLRHEQVRKYHEDFSKNLEPFYFVWRNMYRREFLCANGITFGSERYGDDINFNLRAFFLADSIYALDLPLYHYVHNPFSITRSRFQDTLLDDLMLAFERRLDIYETLVGSKEAKIGLYRYLVDIWLPWLLRNAWESPKHDFLQRVKAIAVHQRIREALHSYKPSGEKDPLMNVVTRLLNRGMYRTAWFIAGAAFILSSLKSTLLIWRRQHGAFRALLY
jgi:glycosyltransferase EpsJ